MKAYIKAQEKTFLDDNLSAQEKLIVLYLLHRGAGSVDILYRDFQKVLSVSSIPPVSRAMGGLEKKGYLRRERGESGPGKPWTLTLLVPPEKPPLKTYDIGYL